MAAQGLCGKLGLPLRDRTICRWISCSTVPNVVPDVVEPSQCAHIEDTVQANRPVLLLSDPVGRHVRVSARFNCALARGGIITILEDALLSPR
jgi:hypothetical protein